MTKEAMLKLTTDYAALMRKHNAVAVELPDLSMLVDPCAPPKKEQLLNHVLWACMNIPKVIDRLAGYEHCLRWIGRIEGVCAAYGFMSVEEVRKLMGVQIHPIEDEYTETR